MSVRCHSLSNEESVPWMSGTEMMHSPWWEDMRSWPTSLQPWLLERVNPCEHSFLMFSLKLDFEFAVLSILSRLCTRLKTFLVSICCVDHEMSRKLQIVLISLEIARWRHWIPVTSVFTKRTTKMPMDSLRSTGTTRPVCLVFVCVCHDDHDVRSPSRLAQCLCQGLLDDGGPARVLQMGSQDVVWATWLPRALAKDLHNRRNIGDKYKTYKDF